MKILSMMLLFLLISIGGANAQNYVPLPSYYPNTTFVQTVPVNVVAQPQPAIVYQWVPVVVNTNTVYEHNCLFRRTQTVVNQPQIQWIYQPVLVYR